MTCVSGEVVSIHLADLSLTGTLPSTLGVLQSMTSLDLTSNYLTNTIPSTFGNLTEIVSLSLGQNKFSGEIPSQLSTLSSLKALNLQSNRLVGTIPSALVNDVGLTSILLGSNSLVGSIPTVLGHLSSLLDLNLAYNSLTGAVPSALCGSSVSSLSLSRVPGGSNTGLTCYALCLSTIQQRTYGALFPCTEGTTSSMSTLLSLFLPFGFICSADPVSDSCSISRWEASPSINTMGITLYLLFRLIDDERSAGSVRGYMRNSGCHRRVFGPERSLGLCRRSANHTGVRGVIVHLERSDLRQRIGYWD